MGFSFPNWKCLRLLGAPALDYGQRLFSRDLKGLQIGGGLLSTFLTAEGRVSEVFWVIREESGLLLLTPEGRLKTLESLIEKYHFAEGFSVSVGDPVTASWKRSNESGAVGVLKDQIFRGIWRHTEFCFDLRERAQGNPEGWALHRIENLIPERGLDYDDETLVFELGFEELCDSGKGCYIGQEVVERVRSRGGQAARKLSSIVWEKSPEANDFIVSEGTRIGSVTETIAARGEEFLSLAFINRKFATPGAKVRSEKSQSRGKILKVVSQA